MEKENNNLKIMLIIFIALSVVLGGFILYDKVLKEDNNISNQIKNQNTKNENNDKFIDTFSLIEDKPYYGFGRVNVKGYTSIVQRKNCDDSYEGCDLIPAEDYIMFNIVETKNKDFLDYIKKSKGNSFFDSDAIGIGCLKDNKISYYNSADEFYDGSSYYKSFELNINDTNKIMSATKENPILLNLEILPNSHPTGVDNVCYSFVSHIEVTK